MAELIFEKDWLSICRLSICRILVRLSICRLSICRLSICRLSICRLSIIRPPQTRRQPLPCLLIQSFFYVCEVPYVKEEILCILYLPDIVQVSLFVEDILCMGKILKRRPRPCCCLGAGIDSFPCRTSYFAPG